MKKAIKKLWMADLRSGKYKQTTGVLKDGDGGYCCLGVLCELYIQKNNITWENAIDQHTIMHGDDLPLEVIEWAGLSENNPKVNYGKFKSSSISCFNDGHFTIEQGKHPKLSFKQIANVIERNL